MAGAHSRAPDVRLIDILANPCGTPRSVTWRVFTGAEPGIWTSLGRF